MSAEPRVVTITTTAELSDGRTVSTVQVGLGLVAEEWIAASVRDAIDDGGNQLYEVLQDRGIL